MNNRQTTETMNTIRTAILETLKACGSFHVMDIAAEIDEHPIQIDRMCDRLQEQRLISMRGGGAYTLTERGERAEKDHFFVTRS
jgi:Mn-dependent DtxR family transcriptional regulator